MKQQTLLKKLILFAVLFGAGFFLHTNVSFATNFTVISTSDSGAGSLRQAITDANADTNEPHTIEFNIAGAGQHAIEVASDLPNVTRQTLIDATSQPGSDPFCEGGSTPPQIALMNETGSFVTFSLYDSSELKGFAVGSDVQILAYNGATISCNFFGTLDGQTLTGDSRFSQNGFVELMLTFGGNTTIWRNVFGAIGGVSDTFGAIGGSGSPVIITGNYFGTDPTLTHKLKNDDSMHSGIRVGAIDGVKVGGVNPADRNYFYHLDYGVQAYKSSALNNVHIDNGVAIYNYASPALRAPIIRNIQESAGNTQLEVELDATLEPGTYRLEIYANPSRRNNQEMIVDGSIRVQHGLDASNFIGTANVVKTNSDAETVNATVSGINHTNLTLTATQDMGGGTFGSTTPLGYYLPEQIGLGVSIETNLGQNQCFTNGASGAWTVQIVNSGPETLHEAGFSVEALSNGLTDLTTILDFENITTSGTAQTNYLGHIVNPSGPSALFFWEGTIQPGQTLSVSLPLTYALTSPAFAMVALGYHLPPDIFNSQRLNEYRMSQAVSQHDVKASLNCQNSGDLGAAITLNQPGITPGGNGTYHVAITNHGPMAYPEGDPASINDMGEFSYLTLLAVPKEGSLQGVQLNGQAGCIANPETIGSINIADCAVVCMDYSEIQEGFDEMIAGTPYSNVLNCITYLGLNVDDSHDLVVTINTTNEIGQDARFGVVSLPISSLSGGSSPTMIADLDFAQHMIELSIHSWITGEEPENSSELLLFGLYDLPFNNSAQYFGLGPGVPPPDPGPGPSPGPGGGVPSTPAVPGGTYTPPRWITSSTEPGAQVQSSGEPIVSPFSLPKLTSPFPLFSKTKEPETREPGCSKGSEEDIAARQAFINLSCSLGITPKQFADTFPWLIILLLAILTAQALVQAYRWYLLVGRTRRHLEQQTLLAHEKKSFLALASHYLRTPLTIINGGVSLLPKEGKAQLELSEVLPPLEMTVNTLIAAIENDEAVAQILPPRQVELQRGSLLRAGFLMPVGVALILLVLINLILATVIRISPSASQLILQALVATACAGVFYIGKSMRVRYQHEKERQTELIRYQQTLDTARNHFIREAHTRLAPDVARLKSLTAKDLPEEPKRFISQGVKEFEELLGNFGLVSQLDAKQLAYAAGSANIGELLNQVKDQTQVATFNNQVPAGVKVRQPQELLSAVFAELVQNASQHNPNKEPIVAQYQKGGNEQTSVTIQDSGEGIAPEKLSLLFKPLSRIEDPEQFTHQGMGMGLFVSRLIMHYLGGDVVADSTLGKGTKMRVVMSDAQS